jgi:excisionase family DNA binding protein
MNPLPPAAAPLGDEALWTVAEVAKLLRASRSWVYKLAESGDLPCIRIGALLRFDPAAIRVWLDSKASGGATR